MSIAGRLRRAGQTASRRLGYEVQRAVRRGRPEPAIGAPIFIVGCGHSGTTLLLAMLSAHSQLLAIPYESSFIERAPADREWFVRQFNTQAAAAGKSRWLEKTPSQVRRIPALLARFPEAQVIVLVRDGRDVACSLRDRSGDFDTGVRRWLDDTAAAESFRTNPAVTFVRYEDLIGQREATLRELLDFLDEPFEPLLLEHHTTGFRFFGRFEQSARYSAQIEALEDKPDSVTGSSHRLYRSWQAKQPVFDGRGRWESDLSAAERIRFKEMAGQRLMDYGYATDNDW